MKTFDQWADRLEELIIEEWAAGTKTGEDRPEVRAMRRLATEVCEYTALEIARTLAAHAIAESGLMETSAVDPQNP